MTKPISMEQLQNASVDAEALSRAVNGADDEDVQARLGIRYPTLAKLLKTISQNGLLGATVFTDANAMSDSQLADGSYAIVTDDSDLSKNGVYHKTDGSWSYSQYNTQKYINDIKNVVSPSGAEGVHFIDDVGFVVAKMSVNDFVISGLISIENSEHPAITDSLGFVIGSDISTKQPNFSAVKPTISIDEPLFVKTLCVFDDDVLYLDVPSIIKQRALQYQTSQLTATLSNAYHSDSVAYAISGTAQLAIDTSKLAENVHLTLIDSAQNSIAQLPINVKKAPSHAQNIKLLIIGDSISNRGLGDILQQKLSSKGHTVKFIGTMRGAKASAITANDEHGQLGEAREGWETGDFTYQVNDRAEIVAVGEEQAYLTSNKNQQWTKNPFLRVANSSDAPDVVKNGHVFDPAFYQARFSLDAPDVVLIQLGTNDIRDRDGPELITNYLNNIKLMIKQITKAWSDVKIIVSVPSTANDNARNQIWESEYHPLLRALLSMQNDVIVCPTWAMQNSHSGYLITSSAGAAKPAKVDAITGALIGQYSDAIHPYYATRYAMADIIASYIVCAKAKLI